MKNNAFNDKNKYKVNEAEESIKNLCSTISHSKTIKYIDIISLDEIDPYLVKYIIWNDLVEIKH